MTAKRPLNGADPVEDEEPSWQRQLVVGLSVLLVIGLLIGGVVAVVGLKFADYAGLGGDGTGSSSPDPILPSTGEITRHPPTTSAPPTTSTPPPPVDTFTLTASPPTAGSYERVDLTGSYPGHEGTTLQVQRSVGDGPWGDFVDVTAHVSDGKFATYIKTAMVGVNHFRMLDKATGKTSMVATVTIG